MFEKRFRTLRKLATGICIKYGETHRIVNCIEELAELQQCLTKYLRYFEKIKHINQKVPFDYSIRINTISEIADVYLTIEEVKYILLLSDEEIYEEMKKKIERGVY